MSIYSDDFQSYATGSSAPFGSFTPFGFFNATIVTTPAGIRGKAKCVEIPPISGLRLTTLIPHPSVSVFSGFYLHTWDQVLFEFVLDLTSICHVVSNADGTIGIKSGTNYIAISDYPLALFKWNWFQINVSLSDVGGFIFVDMEVAVDEQSIVSGSLLTGISTSGIAVLGINNFQYNQNIHVAEFTLDTLQSIGSDPNPGTPKAHITQGLAEVIEVPDSALVRITQGISEIDYVPSTALVRITQGIIELYILPGVASGGWIIWES